MIIGTIQIIPGSVGTELGELKMGEESEQTIVLTFNDETATIQVVLPPHAVDGVIKGLQQAKEEFEKNPAPKKSDLYIPGNAQEVEQVAQLKENIEKGKV
jgi:hypothetical protein